MNNPYMTKEQLEGHQQFEEERKERCARILCKHSQKCLNKPEIAKSDKHDKLKEFINKKPEDFKK